jgi:hypothetical protein
MALGAGAGLVAGPIALRGRFDAQGHVPAGCIVLTVSLPLIYPGAKRVRSVGVVLEFASFPPYGLLSRYGYAPCN